MSIIPQFFKRGLRIFFCKILPCTPSNLYSEKQNPHKVNNREGEAWNQDRCFGGKSTWSLSYSCEFSLLVVYQQCQEESLRRKKQAKNSPVQFGLPYLSFISCNSNFFLVQSSPQQLTNTTSQLGIHTLDSESGLLLLTPHSEHQIEFEISKQRSPLSIPVSLYSKWSLSKYNYV